MRWQVSWDGTLGELMSLQTLGQDCYCHYDALIWSVFELRKVSHAFGAVSVGTPCLRATWITFHYVIQSHASL